MNGFTPVFAISNVSIAIKSFFASDLRKHERIHTGVRNFKCQYCVKKFLRAQDLKRHERIHAGVSNSKS